MCELPLDPRPAPAGSSGSPAARGPRGVTTRRLTLLRGDESGGFVIFGLFMFVAMIIVAGLAVDLMRTETARTKLQNTLDRAVLAASDMEQELDPRAVVEDYMRKAGLDAHLIDVTVVDNAVTRSVSAQANIDVPTFFAHLIGINEVQAPAVSVAAEAVSELEVSLVLDVSGSMSGSKIAELQDAAKAFADILLDTMGSERISINIVPYSTQVSAPPGLLDLLPNFQRDHSYSNCVSFESTDFDRVSFLDSPALAQGAVLDPFRNWGPLSTDTLQTFVCNPEPWAELVLMQNDQTSINTFIDGLEADGNTSIDVGLKWGATLLDPAMGPTLSHFETGIAGLANPVSPFNSVETDKIILLMTDGVNTEEYRLTGIDMTAMSDIYYDDARNEFWVREEDSYDADGDGYRTSDIWFNPEYRHNNLSNFWRRDSEWPHGSGNISEKVRQLTYGELFNRVSVYYNAYYHHYNQEKRYEDWYDWYHGILDDDINNPEKNARLSEICDETKANGIQVFAIGFEVDDAAATVMADCASSNSHFYRVASQDLTATFEQIARTITELRLLQ